MIATYSPGVHQPVTKRTEVHESVVDAIVRWLNRAGYEQVSKRRADVSLPTTVGDEDAPRVDIVYRIDDQQHYIDVSAITATTTQSVELKADQRIRHKERRYAESLALNGTDMSRFFHVWVWDRIGRFPKKSVSLVKKWCEMAPRGLAAPKPVELFAEVHAILASALAMSIRKTTVSGGEW